jgi:hypothetical protein
VRKKRTPSAKPIWAYAYQIDPPQPEDRLRGIEALLEQEHSEAELRAETWRGRFVQEQQITHILVVSDNPDQTRAVNRKLEAELKELNARFSITVPMAITGDALPSGTEPTPRKPTR